MNGQESGDLLLTLQVPLSPELITWILGWHEAITVLAPDTLIEEIKLNLTGRGGCMNDDTIITSVVELLLYL